jgi:hypothetical protein
VTLAWNLSAVYPASSLPVAVSGQYQISLLDLKTVDSSLSAEQKTVFEEAGYATNEGWMNDTVS